MASGLSPGVGNVTIPPDPMVQLNWSNNNVTNPNTVDGSVAGRRLPQWMDPLNGELTVLSMKPANEEGKFPDNPFLIRRSIEAEVGDIEDARPEAKGSRYILKVRQAKQVKKLLKLRKLLDDTEVTVDFHETLNIRKCTVSCSDGMTMSDEDVLKELHTQRVIEAKRFTRKDPKNKDKVIPTPTILLTMQGTTIPEFVYFGYHRIMTRTYYPSPLQCGNCHRYAHTKRNCQNTPICPECSGEHEHNPPCLAEAHCVNCNGPHSARSRECPVKIAETKIVRIKVDEDVPYPEARKRYVARHQNSVQNRLESEKVAELTKQLEEKDEENRKLRLVLQNLIREVAELKKANQPTNQSQPIESSIVIDSHDKESLQTPVKDILELPQSMEVDDKQDTRSSKRRQPNSNPASPNAKNMAPPVKKVLEKVTDLTNLNPSTSHKGKSPEFNRTDISPIRKEDQKGKGKHKN